MKRFITAAILAALLPANFAQARTLELVFRPPSIDPQDICGVDTRDLPQEDLTIGEEDAELTDRQRERFLRRDIRRLQAEDPDKNFPFISVLVRRLAEIDPEFNEADQILALIELHINAGRMEQLRELGLIDQLRQNSDGLTANQRMMLVQYYLNGIGVDKDEAFAHELIRDAAYRGNALALLEISRLALQGTLIGGWDAPLDLTVTMAFGGLLGEMTPGVCGRVERIAEEYMSGGIVSPNPDIALEWYKFAADLGGASAAWKIVEYHLSADANRKNNEEMMKFLRLAVERGITLDTDQLDQLKSAGNVTEAELTEILGFNHSEDLEGTPPSISRFFELTVNIDGENPEIESPYMKYLRELTLIPDAPGWVFTELADEILVRKGRWAGEAEALPVLEEAVARGDGLGMQMLANRLIRYRDDPRQVNRAINLLTETVSAHGMANSMDMLDGLYRCQLNEAPQLEQADLWARNYDATRYETVDINTDDLLAMDPYLVPEDLARLQTQALQGRSISLANYLARLDADPFSGERRLRQWADRADSSDQTMEAYAEVAFALADTPAKRILAVELFRRVYLNNGVTTALDLAIALTEHNARDPEIAAEIMDLLHRSANRGEGASMRLISRLDAQPDSAQKTFEKYAQVIEERGDFLALMFAVPFLSAEKLDDYIDRAVSEMRCGTKDVEEIGDAYAIHFDSQLSYHWRRIGLVMEGGHVLSKLRLTDAQMNRYLVGRAPDAKDVLERALGDGESNALRQLYRLASDPDLETYDPAAAAGYLSQVLNLVNDSDVPWILTNISSAEPAVREEVAKQFNIGELFQRSARNGDVDAAYNYGMLLRRSARTPTDLAESAGWLRDAADNGSVPAMREFGYALVLGIGTQRDTVAAAEWLRRASRMGDTRADELLTLLELSAGR
jgi:TPR repeat protein